MRSAGKRSGLIFAVLLGTACGGEPADLSTHVEQYCGSFGPTLRLAARAARDGQRHSVPLGPIGRGTGAAANERMHFCAGARRGWGEPTAPPMTQAQRFADLADRLDARFVQGDAPDDEVADLLEEMAAIADDVAALPLE